KRWCANPAYAKDLEASAKITKIAKEYFPVFRFRRTIDGRETVIVKPARTTLLPGMQNLVIPPGTMQIYDASVSTAGIEVIHPDISIDSYVPELTGNAIDQTLVYFPIYEISYTYNGTPYSVVIDGASGRVSSADAPHRSSASYVGVMGLAFVLGLMGGLLGIFVSPIFFVMILAGIFVGKILAHQVVKREKPAAGGVQ
ncbi:MAG: hypothetical protein Q4Q04_01745, partial [Methanocorpusculum sp.]|nr:hypothetical protein [Methanocorpusculum sp.]